MAIKNPSGSNIDWYLISIARLKQVGAGILILLTALAGYFFFTSRQKDPRQRAEAAISSAQASIDRLAGAKDLTQVRGEFDRGQAKLTEAKQLLESARFPEAESTALEAQAIVDGATRRDATGRESDAQFLTVEGDVQYQKSGSSDWKKADARLALFNGDWVKTNDNASAELIFSNGSLYTIGPNALLEIYSAINPATSKKQNSVQMQIGSVEINTTEDGSTVKTPGTQIVIDSESTAQVGVDRTDQSTAFVSLKGSSTVTSSAGPSVKVVSGEAVRASKEGTLSPVRKVVMPPALLTPPENQIYIGAADSKIDLTWEKLPAASGYRLQVSRSRLFSTLEINSRRTDPKAVIKVSDGGAFYWRVAGMDAEANPGPYSSFRRFRVKGVGASSTQRVDVDKVPPILQLKRPFNIGGQFYMIEGKTEPGATILINEQEVDADSDGTFKKLVSFDKIGRNAVVVKAVDPAGNQMVQTETVFVEE